MRTILTLTCVVLVTLSVSDGATVPRGKDSVPEFSDSQVGDLKSKLLKLKTLLEELQDEDDVSVNEPRNDATNAGPEAAEVTSHLTDLNEPIGAKEDEDEPTPILAMKKLISQFSPRDIVELKELKELLTKARDGDADLRENHEVHPQNGFNTRNGEYADTISTNGKEVQSPRSKVGWQELARELQSERDAFHIQRRNKGHSDPLPKIEAHTDEGSFGEFRDEIKTAVEKNLLQDVALAIHSGIPVQELLKDFNEHDLPDMSEYRD